MRNDDSSDMTAEKEDQMIDDDYYLFRLGEKVKDRAIPYDKDSRKRHCLGA